MDAKYEEMIEMVPKKYHNDVKDTSRIILSAGKGKHAPTTGTQPADDSHSLTRCQRLITPTRRLPAAAAAAAAGAGARDYEDDPEFDEYLAEMELHTAPLLRCTVPPGGDIARQRFDILDMPMEGC